MEVKFIIKFGFIRNGSWLDKKEEEYYHREQALDRYIELKKKTSLLRAKMCQPEFRERFWNITPHCFIEVLVKEESGEWNRSLSNEYLLFSEAYDILTSFEIENAKDNLNVVAY